MVVKWGSEGWGGDNRGEGGAEGDRQWKGDQ